MTMKYLNEMHFLAFICMLLFGGCLSAPNADMKIFDLTTENDQTTYMVRVDDVVRLKCKALIKNLGPHNIGNPVQPLTKNFVYRLGIIPFEGSVGNNWPFAMSSTESQPLNSGKTLIVVIERTMKISQTICDSNSQICVCIKPAREVSTSNGQSNTYVSYVDNQVSNDLVCMPIKCINDNLQNDPHIVVWPQLINNNNNNNNNNLQEQLPLCFDLFGTAGQTYILLNDTAEDWCVSATLMDDSYFHKVTMKSKYNTVTVNTKGVITTGLEWHSLSQSQMVGDILINFDRREKVITLETGNYPRDIVVTVKLGQHANRINHLDISTPDKVADKYMGGILGVVKRNYLGVNRPVQEQQQSVNQEDLIGAVNMAGRTYPARLTRRNNVDCWFTLPKYAFYPHSQRDYLVENNNDDSNNYNNDDE